MTSFDEDTLHLSRLACDVTDGFDVEQLEWLLMRLVILTVIINYFELPVKSPQCHSFSVSWHGLPLALFAPGTVCLCILQSVGHWHSLALQCALATPWVLWATPPQCLTTRAFERALTAIKSADLYYPNHTDTEHQNDYLFSEKSPHEIAHWPDHMVAIWPEWSNQHISTILIMWDQ